MPRSNRPRGRKRRLEDDEERDLTQALFGGRRTEQKRDALWNVQPVAAASALKYYTCPGCTVQIAPGTAHIVAWRADGLMGEADDVGARRHWHSHCWKIKS
ncbi:MULTISPECIES: hypothetical protein [unclassified Diaminobutyricimonas]|uniref:hypothetical protein n=1 Tax=unclassified Diaminobutyricimonas TaxID=2643261 RepID=UPI0012F47EF7|nr:MULTISPECIES: hypothetical protein [unclassified Diaminobutyricimonas]